jgi:hypothetical protein
MEFRGFETGAGEPLASPGSMEAEESGDLHDRAVAIAPREKKCSTSYIERASRSATTRPRRSRRLRHRGGGIVAPIRYGPIG